MVEVHPRPSDAMSDGQQSLKPHVFQQLMNEIRPLMQAMGRVL
jgi:3-deoxy-7-phosphoheptulonate synthase